MSTPKKDPLRSLDKKTLRQIARHLKIKHYYRKSPSKLRRAINRTSKQRASRITPALKPQEFIQTLINKFSKTTPTKKSPLTREQEVESRRAAERKAYEEHRLRYLFSPSRFVHKGTHDDFILEKDGDIELPDFYQEQELVALPIDPFKFYVYWDFDMTSQTKVDHVLKQASDVFMLKISDVTGIDYDGTNALDTTFVPCDPTTREQYIDTTWHDRNLCVELIYRHQKGTETLLRSNTVYIPPAAVSPIRQDRFAQFVPAQPALTDRITTNDMADPRPQVDIPAAPRELVTAFFDDYKPTPIQFDPSPEVTTAVNAPANVTERARPSNPVQWRPEPSRAVFLKPPEPRKPVPLRVVKQPPAQEHEQVVTDSENGFDTQQTEDWLAQAGGEQVKNWLGLPSEVRWLSDLPTDTLSVMFEQWVTDPYDQALMISYAIWPWEVTEYMPLGSSDWTLRKFLGASLFSWFRPAGSERVLRWHTQPSGSEKTLWMQPQGASEVHWSGSLQPERQQTIHPWETWPTIASGRGMFA